MGGRAASLGRDVPAELGYWTARVNRWSIRDMTLPL